MKHRYMVPLIVTCLLSVAAQGHSHPPQAASTVEQGDDCAVVDSVLRYIRAEALGEGVRFWGFRDCFFFVSEDTAIPTTDWLERYFDETDERRENLDRLRATGAYDSLLVRGGDAHQWTGCILPGGFSFMPESALENGWLIETAFSGEHPNIDGVLRMTFPGISNDECSAVVYVSGAYSIWERVSLYQLSYEGSQWRVVEEFEIFLRGE